MAFSLRELEKMVVVFDTMHNLWHDGKILNQIVSLNNNFSTKKKKTVNYIYFIFIVDLF